MNYNHGISYGDDQISVDPHSSTYSIGRDSDYITSKNKSRLDGDINLYLKRNREKQDMITKYNPNLFSQGGIDRKFSRMKDMRFIEDYAPSELDGAKEYMGNKSTSSISKDSGKKNMYDMNDVEDMKNFIFIFIICMIIINFMHQSHKASIESLRNEMKFLYLQKVSP